MTFAVQNDKMYIVDMKGEFTMIFFEVVDNEGFTNFIDVYTRQDELQDGILIDVTEQAKEVGFVFPVAITQTLWKMIQNVPKSKYGGDADGRLWDVLYMGTLAIKCKAKCEPGRQEINYYLTLPHNITEDGREVLVADQKLKLVFDHDCYGPCITIMLPDED